MVRRFTHFVRTSVPAREEGQGLVEYGLILAVVSFPALIALFALAKDQ